MKALLEALAPGSEDLALARAIDSGRIPAHIAIIMDGNGRWAQQRHLPRVAGHKEGVPAVRTTVETCAQLGVGSLTLYAFSVENWKRPRLEVDTLWRLLKIYLRSELDLMMRHDIRFTALGRLAELPAHVRTELDDVTQRTSGNRGLRLNLAINYGGRAELVDAVNALVKAHAEVTEQSISERLYTAGQPDPDLLIRTSGEMRISNFLLWQIAYAELYVTETLWPDFTRAELLRAILDYQKRDRRYGGVAGSESPDLEPVSLPAPMSLPVR
ncbi:MAG TPA: isoprenyl transferase [Bryobacteraceae bacterium]|jgi:undecaprenyl diphosphate synthase|nr:isoprenyl transferase [Bryobacteraceae bacterium]